MATKQNKGGGGDKAIRQPAPHQPATVPPRGGAKGLGRGKGVGR